MTFFRFPPQPLPKRRPVLAAFMGSVALLNGVAAVLSLEAFARHLADGDCHIYPDPALPWQAGGCGIFLLNAILSFFPGWQGPGRGRQVAVSVVSLVLALGAVPVGSVLYAQALRAHGYTERHAMGWISNGMWVFPGHKCQ